jgi:hypothetical protein
MSHFSQHILLNTKNLTISHSKTESNFFIWLHQGMLINEQEYATKKMAQMLQWEVCV